MPELGLDEPAVADPPHLLHRRLAVHLGGSVSGGQVARWLGGQVGRWRIGKVTSSDLAVELCGLVALHPDGVLGADGDPRVVWGGLGYRLVKYTYKYRNTKH